jgi:hypothetical protein
VQTTKAHFSENQIPYNGSGHPIWFSVLIQAKPLAIPGPISPVFAFCLAGKAQSPNDLPQIGV